MEILQLTSLEQNGISLPKKYCLFKTKKSHALALDIYVNKHDNYNVRKGMKQSI